MNIAILVLAAAGFIVSLYGYVVQEKVKQDPSYKPACDINNSISCTKAFNSQYGKLMGITNTIIGMIFYALIFITEFFNFKEVVYYSAIAGVGASIVFAFLLYTKVRSFCLVCTTVYIINISLLLATLKG